MGYKVITLKADINAANLRQLDAIVTGVRAYNTNEWMNNVYDELMLYVKEGGCCWCNTIPATRSVR